MVVNLDADAVEAHHESQRPVAASVAYGVGNQFTDDKNDFGSGGCPVGCVPQHVFCVVACSTYVRHVVAEHEPIEAVGVQGHTQALPKVRLFQPELSKSVPKDRSRRPGEQRQRLGEIEQPTNPRGHRNDAQIAALHRRKEPRLQYSSQSGTVDELDRGHIDGDLGGLRPDRFADEFDDFVPVGDVDIAADDDGGAGLTTSATGTLRHRLNRK